jgi:hypothetical protein
VGGVWGNENLLSKKFLFHTHHRMYWDDAMVMLKRMSGSPDTCDDPFIGFTVHSLLVFIKAYFSYKVRYMKDITEQLLRQYVNHTIRFAMMYTGSPIAFNSDAEPIHIDAVNVNLLNMDLVAVVPVLNQLVASLQNEQIDCGNDSKSKVHISLLIESLSVLVTSFNNHAPEFSDANSGYLWSSNTLVSVKNYVIAITCQISCGLLRNRPELEYL